MKILHVIPSLNPADGGTVAAVRALALAQKAAGDDPAILSLDAADPGEQPPIDVPRFRLRARPGTYRYSEELGPWLRAHHEEFDCFLIHGLWQYHSYGAWRVLKKARRHYFVFPHGMLDPWFKKNYPLKHLKKWLYWPWSEYRVLRDARRVIFTSDEERYLAPKSFFLYQAHAALVPLGIDSPPWVYDEDRTAFDMFYPQLRGKRLLLFLGRIDAKKGCDLLLEAFAEVYADKPDVYLMMAGPMGVWGKSLKDRAKELGVADRILWPGMLVGGMKWAALVEAELFVLPSHQENFGVAVVEAMAMGRPVLISDRVNIWGEVAIDGAGLICQDTVSSIAHRLREWEGIDPWVKSDMSGRARASFEKRYRIETSVAQLKEVLLNLQR